MPGRIGESIIQHMCVEQQERGEAGGEEASREVAWGRELWRKNALT